MAETLDDRASGDYYVRYDSFGGVLRSDNYESTGGVIGQAPVVRDVNNDILTHAYRQLIAQWSQKIHILEAFNGRYFFSLPDQAQTGPSAIIGMNVENLHLTGTMAINGTGNTLNNVLVGNSGINTLTGNDGNDTLDGNTGYDGLIGGNGSDTCVFRRTDGVDTITETAGVAGDTDVVRMTGGITETEPVIVKQNNDLYLFIDAANYIKVTNEFLQPNYGIERLEVSDCYYISRSDIENIVNTMSAINNDPGMDVMQKYNAMRADQTYNSTLAQSWHQP